MRNCSLLTLMLTLASGTSLAQSGDFADDEIVEELRAVRATLERVETNQQVLLALTRIQIDERRVSSLEAQLSSLRAQDEQLSVEVAANDETLRLVEASGLATESATGVPGEAARVDVSPWRDSLNQSRRVLDDVRWTRRNVEQEIAHLRSRIAETEEILDLLTPGNP